MYEQISVGDDDIFAVRISGEISEREQRQLSKLLQAKTEKKTKIRLLILAEQYPSFNSAEDLYEDLRFVKLHSDRIERMAVVGDQAWKNTWVALFGLFSGIRAEYFPAAHIREAGEWLSDG